MPTINVDPQDKEQVRPKKKRRMTRKEKFAKENNFH
jgi:hypothetical protein